MNSTLVVLVMDSTGHKRVRHVHSPYITTMFHIASIDCPRAHHVAAVVVVVDERLRFGCPSGFLLHLHKEVVEADHS